MRPVGSDQGNGQKCGMALVLVVGMLALMVVIAMAFSVFMRTENMAAGSFYNDVVARQFLQAALVEAENAIDRSTGDDLYPKWDVLLAQGSGAAFSNAWVGPVQQWIPDAARVSTDKTNIVPRWITVGNVKDLEGKVSYVVLNCSDLLDANAACGGDERLYGTSPEELRPQAGWTAGAALRSKRPYATEQELGGGNAPPDLLVTHSAFPQTYDGGVPRDLIDIGSLASIEKNKEKIITALQSSGIQDGSFVYNNLVDYVDDDNVPSDLASPCTERVPMVYEVRAEPSLVFDGAAYNVSVAVGVEWFYPFRANCTDTFKMKVGVTVKDLISSSNLIDETTTESLGAVGPGDIAMREFMFQKMVPGSNGVSYRLEVKLGAQILNSASKAVDSVPAPYQKDRFFTMTFDPMTIPDALTVVKQGFECVDPRFNWDTTPDLYWYAYDPPPGGAGICPEGSENEINKRTIWWTSTEVTPSQAETNWDMHVADAPLRNVGELSYLVRGAAWEDQWNGVKIMVDQRTRPLDTVLDHFVLTNLTIQHGLFNLNASSPKAWAALFRDMPLDAYPGEPAAERVTEDEAQAMAAVMTNFTATARTNVSDIGQVATNLADIVAGVTGRLPVKERALVRNIGSLLDWRQQYFLVLLYGMPRRTSSQGTIADLQAVAEIWRDPLPNDLGEHTKVIRSYTVLQELAK